MHCCVYRDIIYKYIHWIFSLPFQAAVDNIISILMKVSKWKQIWPPMSLTFVLTITFDPLHVYAVITWTTIVFCCRQQWTMSKWLSSVVMRITVIKETLRCCLSVTIWSSMRQWPKVWRKSKRQLESTVIIRFHDSSFLVELVGIFSQLIYILNDLWTLIIIHICPLKFKSNDNLQKLATNLNDSTYSISFIQYIKVLKCRQYSKAIGL